MLNLVFSCSPFKRPLPRATTKPQVVSLLLSHGAKPELRADKQRLAEADREPLGLSDGAGWLAGR